MKHLSYRDGELYIDDVRGLEIVEEMFTPFYVYSKSAIEARIQAFNEAFGAINHITAYSAKALENINILKMMKEADYKLHCVSCGELYRGEAAGYSPEDMIFDGPGKSDEEISKALDLKPMLIQVGSIFELDALKEISEQRKKLQDIGLKINLGIESALHPYWKDSSQESKFGLDKKGFERALTILASTPNLKLKCIGTHLGSQITDVKPYVEASNRLVDLFLEATAAGHVVEYLDMGGGFSIDYEEGEALDLTELASQIAPVLQEVEGKIIFEPGRFLVGDSGLLITQVLGTKSAGEQIYVIVDAGMNDLIRPTLYEAYHEAVPLKVKEGEEITADIVGPITESGDFLGLGRPMIRPKRGEFIAFLNTGAYCSSMASNYNGRRRAAEVLIEGDDFTLIRHRESWEDLYKNDVIE